MRLLSLALLVLAWASTSCAIVRPPVEEVLTAQPAADQGSPSTTTREADLLRRLKGEAQAARQAAAEAPGDADAQVRAARALHAAADALLLVTLLEVMEEEEPQGARAALDAEWTVRERLAGEILSLAEDGAAHAQRALDLEAAPPEAWLWRGVHLTRVAFGLGTTRAVVSGDGAAAWEAVRDARRALDPGLLGAAPLRLEGRVLTQVPWPWRDPERAARRLGEAVALSPSAANHVYHGDALFEDGRESEALSAWRSATTAGSDELTEAVAPLHRELARARLRSLAGAGE